MNYQPILSKVDFTFDFCTRSCSYIAYVISFPEVYYVSITNYFTCPMADTQFIHNPVSSLVNIIVDISIQDTVSVHPPGLDLTVRLLCVMCWSVVMEASDVRMDAANVCPVTKEHCAMTSSAID